MQMLFKFPFFAQLAIRLTLVEVTEKWLPTAATDGRNMFYNPHFFKVLTQAEITFVVAHEVLHCVYDHMTPMKSGDFDPKLLNCAADFNINLELIKNKIGEMPAIGLLDSNMMAGTVLRFMQILSSNVKKVHCLLKCKQWTFTSTLMKMATLK